MSPQSFGITSPQKITLLFNSFTRDSHQTLYKLWLLHSILSYTSNQTHASDLTEKSGVRPP